MTKVVVENTVMKVLKDIVKIRKGKAIIPIVDYIMIEVLEDNKIVVTCSNLDVSIQKELDVTETVTVKGHANKFLVPIQIIKSIKLGRKITLCSFEVIDNTLTVSNSNTHQKIILTDWEEYPKLPSMKKLETKFAIRSDTLKKLDAATLSASVGETRPTLTAVLVRENSIITTDSHRLYHSTDKGRVGDDDLLIPAELIKAVVANEKGKDFFGVLKFDGSNAVIETMDTVYYGRFIDGNYPDVSRLMPSEYKSVFTIEDVDQFKEVMTICKDLTKAEKNSPVNLKIEDKNSIILSTKSDEGGIIENSIPIKANYVEEGFKIAFSSKFMLDAMKQLGEKEPLTFNIVGDLRPFIINGQEKDTFSLLLPIRTY